MTSGARRESRRTVRQFVVGHMRRRDRVTTGARHLACSRVGGVSGGGVSSNGRLASLGDRRLTARPRSRGPNRADGPVVLRVPCGEQWQHVFRAVSRPSCEDAMRGVIEQPAAVDCHEAGIPTPGVLTHAATFSLVFAPALFTSHGDTPDTPCHCRSGAHPPVRG